MLCKAVVKCPKTKPRGRFDVRQEVIHIERSRRVEVEFLDRMPEDRLAEAIAAWRVSFAEKLREKN